MDNDVKVNGLKELEARLRSISTQLEDKAGDAALAAVLYVHSQVPSYPNRNFTIAGDGWMTERQRRWFFAALADGEIEVPYKRTGTLGRTVTSLKGSSPGALSRVETLSADKTVGIIGGNLSYLRYVVGEGEQMWMHQNRWYTLQEVVRTAIPGVVDIFAKYVNSSIE